MTFIFIVLCGLAIVALVVHQRSHRVYEQDRQHIAQGIAEFHGFEFLEQLLAQKRKRHQFFRQLDGVAIIVFVLCLVSLWTLASYGFVHQHLPQAAFAVEQGTMAFWSLFGIR